ncbi:c-type cytochrome [Pseudovibrio sp. Tun.PSC04-5.I4]|uniref:c-type cytochrome n=1 Tax=Pseudovibrio sp. Tun.PSC04-5.I4 TaxID=1798213 RepID=UPI00088B5349|nr:c-type cytochrome [Pseudovibrio sp. Tun.PSC04-5.I4]SDQ75776.1 sulfide dehydrogenase (flavocytochrome c), cytochrome c subunit [Pseudovibrio sp. Tun.PSC04-5.I4]
MNGLALIRPIALALGVLVGVACAASAQDAERGAVLFEECARCHDVGAAAQNRTGPNLNGLFDRKAASINDVLYSKAMKRAGADGLIWTIDTLNIYIENPKNLVSGTRMKYLGMKSQQDRSDLLAYLRQFSVSPANIPEASASLLQQDAPSLHEEAFLEGDHEYGEYLSGECTTCHQVDGSDKGIPSITGWTRPDFIIALRAYKKGHRPHPVMQMIARRLSEEEIAALATYFKALK